MFSVPVQSVDEDFVEYFQQGRRIGDDLSRETGAFLVDYPQLFGGFVNATDV
jgi:hypothetical protein